MSVSRVLIANRGEIAVRIIKACQSLEIETVAAVSEADRESLAAKLASRSVCKRGQFEIDVMTTHYLKEVEKLKKLKGL